MPQKRHVRFFPSGAQNKELRAKIRNAQYFYAKPDFLPICFRTIGVSPVEGS